MPVLVNVAAYVAVIFFSVLGANATPALTSHVVPQAPAHAAAVTLEGTLAYEGYYGPPNYGETPDKDRVEEAIILKLQRPLCALTERQESCDAHNTYNSVQLVTSEGGDETRDCVTAIGPLFRAYTGHHRREILMRVKDLHPC